jgi:hypothetical protein
MQMRRLIVFAALSIPTCLLPAQGTSSPGSPAPSGTASQGAIARAAATVLETEAEGARWAEAAVPASLPASFSDANLRGDAGRHCVHVSNGARIRSGEFVLAGQLGASILEGRGPRAPIQLRRDVGRVPPPAEPAAVADSVRGGRKLNWRALHASVGPLRVDLRQLQVIGSHTEHVVPPAGAEESNAGGEFFPLTLRFPGPGEWMVVTTAGSNWGCFLFSVP